MTIAHWHDGLATGDSTVDAQHKQLFAMFNNLHDAIETGCDAHCVAEAATKLREYVLLHFDAEEELMAKTDMPGADVVAHLREHRDLHEQTLKLELGATPSGPTAALKVITLMHRWLTSHIEVFDRKLADHVRAHG
jgi:hemerythrin